MIVFVVVVVSSVRHVSTNARDWLDLPAVIPPWLARSLAYSLTHLTGVLFVLCQLNSPLVLHSVVISIWIDSSK